MLTNWSATKIVREEGSEQNLQFFAYSFIMANRGSRMYKIAEIHFCTCVQMSNETNLATQIIHSRARSATIHEHIRMAISR